MSGDGVDRGKRRFLTALTTAVGATGAVFAATPFVLSMTPSARARAAGAPVEVDISKIEPGQMLTVEWRGKPVWLVRRTKDMLDSLPKLDGQLADPKSVRGDQQPTYAQNEHRSIKPDLLVLVGICTHLGCIPIAHQGEYDGFFCPCHGSVYDTSGRIRQGPAPTNLPVPPYAFISDSKIRIG